MTEVSLSAVRGTGAGGCSTSADVASGARMGTPDRATTRAKATTRASANPAAPAQTKLTPWLGGTSASLCLTRAASSAGTSTASSASSWRSSCKTTVRRRWSSAPQLTQVSRCRANLASGSPPAAASLSAAWTRLQSISISPIVFLVPCEVATSQRPREGSAAEPPIACRVPRWRQESRPFDVFPEARR